MRVMLLSNTLGFAQAHSTLRCTYTGSVGSQIARLIARLPEVTVVKLHLSSDEQSMTSVPIWTTFIAPTLSADFHLAHEAH